MVASTKRAAATVKRRQMVDRDLPGRPGSAEEDRDQEELAERSAAWHVHQAGQRGGVGGASTRRRARPCRAPGEGLARLGLRRLHRRTARAAGTAAASAAAGAPAPVPARWPAPAPAGRRRPRTRRRAAPRTDPCRSSRARSGSARSGAGRRDARAARASRRRGPPR